MTTRQEIESRVAAFAAAQIPPLTVAYENIPFTKPSGSPWLECIVRPASTVTANLEATSNRERGTIAINVWTPIGKGVTKAEAIASLLVKTFVVYPKTGNVSIEAPLSLSQYIPTEDGYGCLPTSCPYRVESSAT